MDCLVRILPVVHHDSVALNVIFPANFTNCDHHVTKQGFIFSRLLHINERVQLMRLSKEDEMDLGGGASRGEHNDFVVLIDHVLHGELAFDDLVEWRILKLVKRHLLLLQLGQDLAFFWLRPPFSNCKDRGGLAELRENEVGVFIKSLQLLTESPAQSKRFDFDFEEEHVLTRLY